MINYFYMLMCCFFTEFLGLVAGGIPGILFKRKMQKFQGILMGFAGGFFIAFICFEILPEAFKNGNFFSGVICMAAGVLVSVAVENFFIKNSGINSKYIKSGIILSIGIILHNIPEGMALGTAYYVDFSWGLTLSAAIIIHCIPEGLMITLPLKMYGVSIWKILLIYFIISFSMAFGGFIGFNAAVNGKIFTEIIFAFGGGIMLYSACGEILPESSEFSREKLRKIGALLGFLIGVLITSV